VPNTFLFTGGADRYRAAFCYSLGFFLNQARNAVYSKQSTRKGVLFMTKTTVKAAIVPKRRVVQTNRTIPPEAENRFLRRKNVFT
jgi:hypothetical protein